MAPAGHAWTGRQEITLPEAPGWRIVHAHLSVAVPDDECVMLQRRWKYGIPATAPGS